jgi:hypothetical protein
MMDENASDDGQARFAIFRTSEARSYDEAEIMEVEPPTPVEAEGMQRVMQAGLMEGNDLKLLFAMPGLSLSYVWFKSGFPLFRHSHSADCLYYIVGGSLKMGREELGVGDGFFIGDGVPYTYTPGPDGVEVLEFRTSSAFNIKLLANNPAFWDKAVETLASRRDAWAEERMPPSAR